MLEVLRITEKGLEVLKEPEKNCWINLTSPTDEELLEVKKIFDIPKKLLGSLKDMDEVPAIMDYDEFEFIIIKTPYNNVKNDLEYYSVPVGIFIKEDVIVTVCYYENDALPKLKNQKFPFRKTQTLFRLMLITSRLYIKYLNEIKKKMYLIEGEIETNQKNKVILKLLEIQKSLVYFSTSIKSNEILIERILDEQMLMKKPEDKKLITLVIDENRQALEMTTIYSNILSSTIEAFASIISNNLNMVMKVLASMTILIAIPTLVASIYGMNVTLPFQDHPHAFRTIMITACTVSIISAGLLWQKKYL